MLGIHFRDSFSSIEHVNLARYCFHIPYRIAEGANSDFSIVGEVKNRRPQFIVIGEGECRLTALPPYVDD
jgi:hypothetical protein